MSTSDRSNGHGTIRQTIHVPKTPGEVFESLVNPVLHAKLVGVGCLIDAQVGGTFRVGEDMIEGIMLELTLNRRIVQTWRIIMEGWPADHDSKVTIDLSSEASGTRITLVQTDVPTACIEVIEAGWYEFYWNRLGACHK